jgi:hypothetical protein
MPFLLIAAAATGCTAPAEPLGPTVERVAAQSSDDFDRLYVAGGDTLRAHCFRLDRQDREQGVITTFPETTANWFEFWRPQPQPAYYWLEANGETVQRQATLRLTPAGSGAYDLQVQVDRFRYSLPERQVTNSAEALRLYSNAIPTYSGTTERPAETAHWIPLGRDATMESQVLRQIIRRYGGNAASSQPAF